MTIDWLIEPEKIVGVKAFVAKHQGSSLVQHRIKQNLRSDKPPISKPEFWERHVGCLLTSQQKSGPNSPSTQFNGSKPFPLSYEVCHQEADVEAFCLAIFKNFGGLRFTANISRSIAANLHFLNDGGWEQTLSHLEAVRLHSNPTSELQAANFLADSLQGIGPKQSRNLLMSLGLSRFETPIDSRIANWLNDYGFPINAKALSNRTYYSLVSSAFQKLSTACGVEPFILNTAIFVSYDGDEWTSENVIG